MPPYARRVPSDPQITLEDLKPDVQVTGIHPDGPVTVVRAQWHGAAAVTLTYRHEDGTVQEQGRVRGLALSFGIAIRC